MGDRVEDLEAAEGIVAPLQLRQRHHDPGRGMGILPAVFAHARRIGLDIAGIPGGIDEIAVGFCRTGCAK